MIRIATSGRGGALSAGGGGGRTPAMSYQSRFRPTTLAGCAGHAGHAGRAGMEASDDRPMEESGGEVGAGHRSGDARHFTWVVVTPTPKDYPNYLLDSLKKT